MMNRGSVIPAGVQDEPTFPLQTFSMPRHGTQVHGSQHRLKYEFSEPVMAPPFGI